MHCEHRSCEEQFVRVCTHFLNTDRGPLALELPLQCPICREPVTADDFRSENAVLLTGELADVAAHASHFFVQTGNAFHATEMYQRNVEAMGIAYALANKLMRKQ
jgi:hypothetical protein